MEYCDYDILFSLRISAEINREPMDSTEGGIDLESESVSGFKMEYFVLVEFALIFIAEWDNYFFSFYYFNYIQFIVFLEVYDVIYVNNFSNLYARSITRIRYDELIYMLEDYITFSFKLSILCFRYKISYWYCLIKGD